MLVTPLGMVTFPPDPRYLISTPLLIRKSSFAGVKVTSIVTDVEAPSQVILPDICVIPCPLILTVMVTEAVLFNII